MENYKEISDSLLLEMKKQEESSNKRILHLEKLLITIAIVVALTMIFVGCYLTKDHLALGIALLVFGAAVVFATSFIGVRIEHDTGYYECPVCKKKICTDNESCCYGSALRHIKKDEMPILRKQIVS